MLFHLLRKSDGERRLIEVLIDKRFDERIWKAQQEIMNAFSELSADVSNGKLEVCVEEEKLKELYRRKANQAKTMLNSCVDSLETQYKVVPIKSQKT